MDRHLTHLWKNIKFRFDLWMIKHSEPRAWGWVKKKKYKYKNIYFFLTHYPNV